MVTKPSREVILLRVMKHFFSFSTFFTALMATGLFAVMFKAEAVEQDNLLSIDSNKLKELAAKISKGNLKL